LIFHPAKKPRHSLGSRCLMTQNFTPSGHYSSWLSKCHSQWTLCFMPVKIPSDTDVCYENFWPKKVHFPLCPRNINSFARSVIWVCKKHGLDEVFPKFACGKLEARWKTERITCKQYVNIKAEHDEMAIQMGSSDGLVRPILCPKLLCTFLNRGFMWPSGVSCRVHVMRCGKDCGILCLIWCNCEFLWCSIGPNCGFL
jgi:hypothetical protein